MRQKRTKMIKLLSTMAIVVMLVFGMIMPALAADYSEGTEANPARGAITKKLQMPAETVTPTATFSFAFAKKDLDGSTSAPDLALMPTLGPITVSFAAADVGTTAAGIKTVSKESANFVAGAVWPRAGVYTYTVTETAGTYTLNATPPPTETMVYSQAVYEVEVWVANSATPGGAPWVHYIVSKSITTDTGGTGGGAKEDPTPGGDGTTYFESQMIFMNTYTKRNGGPDPEDPNDEVFRLSKVVSGTMADQTRYFSFSVTVNSPAVGVAPNATYVGYVVENVAGTPTVVTSAANYAGTISAAGGISFTAGTPLTILLKHGQRLVFTDLYVGSSFTVTEAAAADYTPSYVLTLNNVAGAAVNGVKNTALTAPSSGVAYLGELTNIAAFTNTHDMVTPTGIAVDNLPYYALFSMAVIAFILFVLIKARRNAKYRA